MREAARILVVDDEQDVREFVADFLEAKGYSVITAASGSDALISVEQLRPDLVLMDIRMPKMDGLEAIDRIRAIDRRVGIIMLTAVDDEGIAREAMRREAYDYLTKPLDLGYLELAILTKLAREGR
jgi:CheY-like chemotaxis protein